MKVYIINSITKSYILNIKIRPLVTEYALMIKLVDRTSSAHSFNPISVKFYIKLTIILHYFFFIICQNKRKKQINCSKCNNLIILHDINFPALHLKIKFSLTLLFFLNLWFTPHDL